MTGTNARADGGLLAVAVQRYIRRGGAELHERPKRERIRRRRVDRPGPDGARALDRTIKAEAVVPSEEHA